MHSISLTILLSINFIFYITIQSLDNHFTLDSILMVYDFTTIYSLHKIILSGELKKLYTD